MSIGVDCDTRGAGVLRVDILGKVFYIHCESYPVSHPEESLKRRLVPPERRFYVNGSNALDPQVFVGVLFQVGSGISDAACAQAHE